MAEEEKVPAPDGWEWTVRGGMLHYKRKGDPVGSCFGLDSPEARRELRLHHMRDKRRR